MLSRAGVCTDAEYKGMDQHVSTYVERLDDARKILNIMVIQDFGAGKDRGNRMRWSEKLSVGCVPKGPSGEYITRAED